MIELWTWPTPNGQKVHIALEEAGLPYEVRPVNIGAGAQFTPEFLAINPNHRIPAITDTDGPGGGPINIFESGAILIYLAEKSGNFLPVDPAGRYKCLQWLMFQMGGIGPMFGQYSHFSRYAPEKIPYALERYGNEAKRLMRVLEKGLAEDDYLAGTYSIADMASYPWIHIAALLMPEFDWADYPALKRWHDAIAARPAVARGMALLKETAPLPAQIDDKIRENLFGAAQLAKR